MRLIYLNLDLARKTTSDRLFVTVASGYAWLSAASAHLFKCQLTSKDIKRISLLFPGLYALNHPPGLLSMILFPGPGLVPAVTLATGPGSRGLRTCLTTSLSLSLCVMRRAEPAAGPPALTNLLKCPMLLETLLALCNGRTDGQTDRDSDS